MSDTLRICLFDSTPDRQPSFRGCFEQLKNVHLLTETGKWEELREWLRQASVDMIAVNLDGDHSAGLEVVERIAQISPACAILGVGSALDANTIIGAMRAGCTQFVAWPIDPNDLETAVERIRATRVVGTAVGAKRFCVIGSSGGAGATTVACNLAMELGHLTDRRVSLVDLNLEFGDIACAFDCNPKFTVSDVSRADIEIDRMLVGKAMHELPCNISILARPESVADARLATPEGLSQVLRLMKDMYPCTVVDLPRVYSAVSAAALHEADRVLVVTQLGVPFIRNATRIYECLLQMDTDEDRIEIVLNRCRANFERITPEEVETHFGRPVFGMIPNDYRRVQNSLDFGHPIMADAPSSPARLAIQEMARRLANEPGDDLVAAGRGRSTGLLGKLLGRSGRDSG
jgi:pilus assembly protein CpaE